MGAPFPFCFPSGSGSGLGVAIGSVGHNGLFGDGPTHCYEIIIIIIIIITIIIIIIIIITIIIRLKQRHDNLSLFVYEGALDIE